MANTGYKQAVIAYKVRNSDGAALDINGQPLLIGGAPNPLSTGKQAIFILSGTSNPNPALYDVAGSFTAEGSVTGNPTYQVSADCPAGHISLNQSTIILDPTAPAATLIVSSSDSWSIQASPPGAIISVSPPADGRGDTVVTLTRTAALGQGYLTFINTLGNTASVYVVNVSTASRDWILATHAWNNLGFWQDAALWGI